MSPLGINTEDMHGPSMETTVMVVNRTSSGARLSRFKSTYPI